MHTLTSHLPRRVRAGRLAWQRSVWLALAALALAWGADPVAAQGKLEAQYEATLSGIPVGRTRILVFVILSLLVLSGSAWYWRRREE